ncbi:MAG TPA: winged helix-turn-helix domain-containing protein [Candidatus Saccharimonadales bacterium]|nr:winged helix-turn-helix domain-containing protein [Candidatus Saccharimonadales bacterium]
MTEVHPKSKLMPPGNPYRIADGRVVIYPEIIVADGAELNAPPMEIDITTALARQPDIPMQHADLGREIWGYASDRTLVAARVHIHRLRDRLGEELGHPKSGAIVTRNRVGYCAVSSLADERSPLHEDEHRTLFIADQRIAVQPETFTAVRDGELLELSKTQFKILALLASQPDMPVKHDDFLVSIWGSSDKYVCASARVHVHALRRQLGAELGSPWFGAIRQQRNVGYYAVSSIT